MIELDVPKDGLGFDGTSAAVHHPAFAGEQLPCLSLEPVGRVVDLDGPPVGSALVAHSPERASLAVDGPVHGHFRPVAEVWTSPTQRQLLQQMIRRNPALQLLIDELDLELVE